jgi:hypothetical protein
MSGFGGEDLKKSANQKQELPVVAMFVNTNVDRDKMSNLYRGPSIDASYQVSVPHWYINMHNFDILFSIEISLVFNQIIYNIKKIETRDQIPYHI